MSTITRDPRSLKLHPLFTKLPPPDYETIAETNDPDKQKARDAAWGSFIDNMREAGPEAIPPLIVTGDLVIDGRRRLKAARALQWKEIRCDEVPKEHAALIMVNGLLGTKELSKGAKVYIAMQLEADYIASVQAKLKCSQEQGPYVLRAVYSTLRANYSYPQLAEIWGVSLSLIEQAQRVRKLFAEKPEVKAEYEPQLMWGEKNLWNVISGSAGAEKTKDLPRPIKAATQLDLWQSSMNDFSQAIKPWTKIKAPEREVILTQWREALHTVPPAAIEDLIKVAQDVLNSQLQTA